MSSKLMECSVCKQWIYADMSRSSVPAHGHPSSPVLRKCAGSGELPTKVKISP
jgi:hypothetical protein